MNRSTFLVLSLTLSLPAGLAAQDEWEQQVRRQLDAGGGVYMDNGYALSHSVYVGSLDDDEDESVELDLDQGFDYAVLGTCDADCSDLDLVLFANSDEVDDDVELDDVSGSGTFRVEVRMEECSQNPCRYGIGVYSRRSSDDAPVAGRMSRVGDSAEPNVGATPTYGAVTLSAGFDPDPTLRSILAGGTDEVELDGCSGYINAAAPDLDFNYTTGTYKLHIYAKSDIDITLIVNQPDGSWVCSDDVDGTNPALTFETAPSGQYNIWIGTYSPSESPLPEAMVYISEQEPRW